MMPETEERQFNITQDALTDLIEYLQKKARQRISAEMITDIRREIGSKTNVAIACMPLISTRILGTNEELALTGRTIPALLPELRDDFEERVFNYFYAEIFDYMKAMQREIQSKETM